MYQGFYHLKENPFRLTSDPAFLCMTALHREALSGLVYSIYTRPGLTVLLGEAGTGKTTLLYSLLGLLEKRRFATAMCTNPMLSTTEFYDLLMMKFGVECNSTLKSRQLAALEQTLHQNRAAGRPSVLIVDEAQRLSVDLLEEIRMLLNLEMPHEKLLHIIMAGQPELGGILARTEMRQLKQRVSCICKLKPLTLKELSEYIDHRLARAGLANQSLFAEGIIEQIYDYTRGIPRLVNTMCDNALQTGFAMQAPRITAGIIDEVARDLELARMPVAETLAAPPAAQMVVERPAAPVPAANGSAHKPSGPGTASDGRIPLADYANRQKTMTFLGSLMDRWK